MDRIIAPIVRKSRGAAVRNLQDGLLLLLRAEPADPADGSRRTLLEALAADQRDAAYGDATTEAVARFQREQRVAFDLPLVTGEQVDDATAGALNLLLHKLGAFDPQRPPDAFSVGGRVEYEDGTPGAGLRVDVFDRDLGAHRELLGGPDHPALTDDKGDFSSIAYRRAEFAAGEGGAAPNANLVFELTAASDMRPRPVLRVYRRSGAPPQTTETLLTDLALGHEAAQVEDVRIVVAGRPGEGTQAEYGRLLLALEPLLLDSATPAVLDQDQHRDIDFAAREIRWDPAQIRTMVLAWRLARSATPEPQHLAETCYGLLRHGPPTEVAAFDATLAALLAGHDRWAAKLDDALAHRIIDGDAAAHLARLRQLLVQAEFRPGGGRRAGAGDILVGAGIAHDEAARLLDAYRSHDGPVEAFWTNVVPKQLGWDAGKIGQVQDALHLADTLAWDLPLMEGLRRQRIATARDLVQLERSELVALVTKVGLPADAPGATVEERVAIKVNAIASTVQALYPTDTVAHLAATSNDPQLRAARDLLARFFDKHAAVGQHEPAVDAERFDMLTSPVTAYLEAHDGRVFAGLGDDDKALLTAQLQRLQRVFRLGVNRAQSEALLDLGLDSAFHIVRFSPEHFAAEFGDRLGGEEPAKLAYGRAERIAGTILTMYTDTHAAARDVRPAAMMKLSGTLPAPDPIAPLKEVPAYRALFGSLSLCDCGHCQSVYSPAAYYVDLLHMLDRPALGAFNPVQALFDRRPDLAHIQLTCENTNTLIPYVDLATEVLESFVANRAPKAFNVPPGPPHQRLPTPSADELRVNPVYLTADSATFADQAYAALQQAVFPLALPLNLPLETGRAYLGHLGTSRVELMTLLDLDPGIEPLLARAAELLLLAPEEFELVTGATFGGASSKRPATTTALFGLTTSGSPATAFNHAEPEFVRNPALPDPRRALIASLQNVLSLIAPPAIPASEWGAFGSATEAAVNTVLKQNGQPQTGRTDAPFWNALVSTGMLPLSVLVCPVPMFLDRSGLSYVELVALVKTRFVNHTMQGEGDLDYLARLGVPASDVRSWIVAGFPALPPAIQSQLTAAAEDPGVFTRWVQRRAQSVVINTGFEAPCDLDRATLMHLDGTLLSPDELQTLMRFVRLWRKLGWALDDLDQVLEPGGLENPAAIQTVLLLANVQQQRAQLDAPFADLATLWLPIARHGQQPLYDRLFRNRAALLINPILALNRERTELAAAQSATPPALSDHLGPVMGAFRLTAPDLQALRQAIELDDRPPLPPAPLDLSTLSAIYRVVALARALRISVRELLVLRQLSGLAVFERPDRMPRGDALVFSEMVEKVRASAVKVGELDYLCGTAASPPGPAGVREAGWLRTLASIRDGLQHIAAEEPVEHDPAGEALTTRLTELLGADDARATSALVFGRDAYSAALAGLPAAFAFPPAVAAKASYDAARKQLRFRGAMSAPERAALLAATGVPAPVQLAYAKAVKAVDAQPRAFVARALASMFGPGEAEAALIDTPSIDAAGEPIAAAIDAKIEDLMARRRTVLTHSLIRLAFTTATGLAPDVVAALLENETVLASTGGTGPAMPDYQALDGGGLDAEYFANPDLMAPSTLLRTDASIDFDLQGAAPGPGLPAVGFSVRWTGQIYVPATGELVFHLRCTDGARVTVDGTPVFDEWQDQPESEFDASLRLDGGRFYPVQIDYYNKTGNALLTLGWGSPAIAAAAIPQRALYTSGRLDALLRNVERMDRVAALLAPFKVSADELRWLSGHGELALSSMPTAGPVAAPVTQAMFRQWLALFDFAALRDRFPAASVSLIDVAGAASPEQAADRFGTLVSASRDTVDAIVAALTRPVFDSVTSTWSVQPPDLTQLVSWRRVADTLALVQRTGAAPAQLLAWAMTREIDQTPTGAQTLWLTWMATDANGTDRQPDNARLAQAGRDTVRALYDDARWRVEARRLNDALRIRRRSALTAFVLALPEMMQAKVDNSDRLFEFLLIDVEMDPCMETSRIKQGISSVQMFLQRVRLNLESPRVPPTRLDLAQIEWKKNYRVWEANRKVFFHPESYIVMGLRDDKTPFFEELEAALRQDQLTDDSAELALRSYLEKLDGVAKLIVCGTCIDGDGGLLHVFGRTATTPFVFYHRWIDGRSAVSWADGSWTPWRKLPVDVAAFDEGDDSGVQLMPIVWNRRLYLFWPLFELKPHAGHNQLQPDGFDEVSCWHIKLAWSEYKDGRWSAKQTGVPFVVSNPFFKQWPDEPTRWDKAYTPQVLNWHRVDSIDVPWGSIPYNNSSGTTTVQVTVGDDDPALKGTVIKDAGDWAYHSHVEKRVRVKTLMPKAAAHYLDASASGSALTIRVFCRYKGTPRGQSRVITTDSITVVRGGQRSDRVETSQEDSRISDVEETLFQQVGSFNFPACGAHLEGASSLTDIPYNNLARPKYTINAYMALRNDWPGGPGLRLGSTAPPLLDFVPTPFEVIDSDNRSGFDAHAPFFYQDNQRCYLVTHQSYAHAFAAKASAVPAARVPAAPTVGGPVIPKEQYRQVADLASQRINPWADDAARTRTVAVAAGKSSDRLIDTDNTRAAAVQPEYTFTPLWHAYTCPLLGDLNSAGLAGLYTLANQSRSDARLLIIGVIGGAVTITTTCNFETVYKPDREQVVQPYPLEGVDFGRTASYAQYNWEIFFHAPMTVGTAYSRAGRYEEALRWFHFVFDPTVSDADTSAARHWRFLPFRNAETSPIGESLELLSYAGTDKATLKKRADLQASIQEWMEHPFNPHLIARRRPVAYMKYVFMEYVDNLIRWGDDLFRRDTMESLNEAAQLYVFAANLLGRRREATPAPGSVAPETFQTLRGKLDMLSNAQVDLETRLPFTQLFAPASGASGQLAGLPQALYFCLPQNDRLLGYWDTVADRLFKIRHCMNIDGTVRELELFDKEIDPMLLVEAVAHGLDIGSVLDDLYAPLPRYRLNTMLQQAVAMCNLTCSIGATLLSIREKRDTERMAAFRSGQEMSLLEQLRGNKKLQIDEAEQACQALEQTARSATARVAYFDDLLSQGLIAEEIDQLGAMDESSRQQEMAGWIESSAQMLNLIPNVTTGTASGTTIGGSFLGAAASAVGRSFSSGAAALSYRANRASITGVHTRRAEDWRYQRDQAKREVSQVERQKAAARIRKEIAQADLRHHETAIEHAHGVDDMLRSKFTNAALYDVLADRGGEVLFQAYQHSYKLAKSAERCWRHQSGTDARFIRFGAWDSSVKGLLAGEQLLMQLKQMERASIEQTVDELEIVKHVSIGQIDPLALIALKETGSCEVELPEWLFDIDFPGHYFRRLKTVSITIPAVVGPYTGLNATLTLLSSRLRESGRVNGTYTDDANFRDDHLAVQAIAVSSGQNDGGRFALDLHDDKYLPFEGAGAVSFWRIDLPRKPFRSFDHDSISDVVFHLKYTARHDEMLAAHAEKALQDELDAVGGGSLFRLFSLRHEFAGEWQRLRTSATRAATITISRNLFPVLAQGGSIEVTELHSLLILKEPRPTAGFKASLTPKVGPGAGVAIGLDWPAQPALYRHATKTAATAIPIDKEPTQNEWLIQLAAPAINADVEQIRDLLIVARYSVAA